MAIKQKPNPNAAEIARLEKAYPPKKPVMNGLKQSLATKKKVKL
jgi:hypothetical protein